MVWAQRKRGSFCLCVHVAVAGRSRRFARSSAGSVRRGKQSPRMTSRVLCALFSILLIAIATPTPVPAAQQTVTYIHFSNETRRYIWVTARPDANSAANVGAWCVAPYARDQQTFKVHIAAFHFHLYELACNEKKRLYLGEQLVLTHGQSNVSLTARKLNSADYIYIAP